MVILIITGHTAEQYFFEKWGIHPIKISLDIRSCKGAAGEKIFSYHLRFCTLGITSPA
jgi:hypothetical protein